jgi:hypothetical protein
MFPSGLPIAHQFKGAAAQSRPKSLRTKPPSWFTKINFADILVEGGNSLT